MRRGRILILVGLLLLILILALLFGLGMLPGLLGGGGGQGEVPVAVPTIETVNVVLTTQRIPQWEVITPDVLQMVSIPREHLIEGMFTSVEDAVGLRAKYDLDAHLYLTNSMTQESTAELSAKGSIGSLLIPKGLVAVSIPITRLSSVSYGLERGDFVDVIVTILFVDLDSNYQSILPNATSSVIAPGPSLILTLTSEGTTESKLETNELLQTLTAQTSTGGIVSPLGRMELDETLGQPFYVVPSEPQRPRLVSQSVIHKVMVLQLGDFSLEEKAAPQAAEGDQANAAPEDQLNQNEPVQTTPPKPPDVITLVVTPQDAVTLNYLVYSGAQLTLALRSPEDDSQDSTEAVTLQYLLDQYSIPIPAKLPYGMEPRLDEIKAPVLSNDVVPVEGQ